MALTLDIGANTRDAVRGVKDIGEALDDLADSLDDMARDATQSGDKVERAFEGVESGLKEIAREGDDATEKLERGFRDMIKDAEKAEKALKDTGKAADKIGDEGKKGFGKASEATAEFKDEALSNLSEVTSSFDGSMESIGDLVQGTLGGVAANIPGIGLAAAGAAAGVGLLMAAWQSAQEATEEAKNEAYNYAFAVMESGKVIAQSEALKSYTSDLAKMKDAQDIAKVAGWKLKDAIKALATGDGLPELTKAFDEGIEKGANLGTRALELDGALRGAAEGAKLGAIGTEAFQESLYDLTVQSGTATGKVDELGREIYELPDGKTVTVDAATKTAKENIKDVDDMKLRDKTLTVRVRPDTRDWDNWRPNPKTGVVMAQNTGRTWE